MVCGLVVLLFCVGMSGCSSLASDKDKFVGTWKAANGATSVLFSDGTCTITGITGT